MPMLQSKDEMKYMVLAELAGLCKKLVESSAITDRQRTKIRQFVNEFDSLMSMRDESSASARFEGTELLERIARFLPQIAEDYRPEAYLDRSLSA